MNQYFGVISKKIIPDLKKNDFFWVTITNILHKGAKEGTVTDRKDQKP